MHTASTGMIQAFTLVKLTLDRKMCLVRTGHAKNGIMATSTIAMCRLSSAGDLFGEPFVEPSSTRTERNYKLDAYFHNRPTPLLCLWPVPETCFRCLA
jgi:hypothetical protein